jgi:UDP-N-acetylmuramate--alanine ligase
MWQEKFLSQPHTLHVHLLGIGGAGLGPIAKVLLELGVQVSGSDRQASAATEQLARLGATIFPQQVAENFANLARPDVVLMSSAVAAHNPERQAAEQLGLPVVKREQFLPVLLAQRKLIAVAGTHGKSTTTAMIVKLLREAGMAAGYIVGAELPGYGNAAAGSSDYFVIEADEYDHMFLGLQPTVAVITNVEWDHPDCYPTPQSFQAAFAQFAAATQPGGVMITCADDAGAEQLSNPGCERLRYGLAAAADLQARNIVSLSNGQLVGEVRWHGECLGDLTLAAPGLHNLRNGLAALAVARWCGVATAQALSSLNNFEGVARRIECKGERNGVLVIDDYAHHPTEVQATLAALRQRYPQRRLWAIFQPHTFSRSKALLAEMATSFADADQVIVTDIYAAREQDDGSVHARDLVGLSPHPQMKYVGPLAAAANWLTTQTQPGDLVVTLGAGDVNKVGLWLLQP